VQYRTETSENHWAWLPAEPKQGAKALVFVLAPGQAAVLGDGNGPLLASRVRIWAEAGNGLTWDEYRNEDLWLVPETEDGYHRYRGDEVEAFTLPFEE
jgi:hypothetical protein